MDQKSKKINTKAVHSGSEPDPKTKAMKVPIFASNTYAYNSLNEFLQAGVNAYSIEPKDFEYFYSRTANPTTNALEQKISEVIGSESAYVTSSGMAAISFSIMANFKPGTKILLSDSLYRSSHSLLTETLPNFGIPYEMHDFRDLSGLEKIISSDEFSVVHFESPANPTLRCFDIKEICKIIHGKNSESIITFDNTFGTPVCQHPLELGVNFEIHSLSKYINGHGDALGGAVAGNAEDLSDFRRRIGETFGQIPSPFNSYLIMRGLKTIGLRVERQCSNAFKVAQFLEGHNKVKKVFYPGLSSHPEYAIAKKQMNPFGGMVAFELKSSEHVSTFLDDKLKLIRLAMDLGDIQSLIEFPAYQTHYDLDFEIKEKIGITDELLRLSVGIENVEDIINDLEQALLTI